MRLSVLSGPSLAALLLLSPGNTRAADDNQIWDVVAEIGRLYDKLEYERAFSLVQNARRIPRGVDGEVTLSLYEGILLCEMDRFSMARASFRQALLARPEVLLPENVSPKLEKFFEETRLAVVREKALLPVNTDANATPAAMKVLSPRSQSKLDAERVALMTRLVELSGRTRGMTPQATLGALRELYTTGEWITAATTREQFQACSEALGRWETKYLPPSR